MEVFQGRNPRAEKNPQRESVLDSGALNVKEH